MNAQWVSALFVGVGLFVNACWTVFNARMSSRVLERIDGVKDWVRENYHDRTYLDAKHEEFDKRLVRAKV